MSNLLTFRVFEKIEGDNLRLGWTGRGKHAPALTFPLLSGLKWLIDVALCCNITRVSGNAVWNKLIQLFKQLDTLQMILIGNSCLEVA